jgi:hypothetical protein
MCATAQTTFPAWVQFCRMKLYVLLPNGDGALPELQLVMESEDRDALKERAQELAEEICEALDPALVGSKWVGEDELILEGYCRFAIRR